MNKTYKKSDIDKYHKEHKKDINELIDTDGIMIDKNDNYKATPSIVKSKKTTDDFVRGATQGPEAYFIYGGPYYGINYNYVVNEDNESIEETISPETLQDLDAFHSTPKKYSRDPKHKAKKKAKKDISQHYYKPKAPGYDLDPVDDWAGYPLPYDTKFDLDYIGENKMKSLVDEMYLSKKDNKGIVKRANEQDLLGDEVVIPDVVELKKTFEKPMVGRKLNHLLDLIEKEDLTGEELAIVLNHLFNNIDVTLMSDKHREILGDKIKYGGE
jgi:hypothetical protein